MRSLHYTHGHIADVKECTARKLILKYHELNLYTGMKSETYNTESILVKFIILLPFDGNGVGPSRYVNWTVSFLPFSSFSLEDKNTGHKDN